MNQIVLVPGLFDSGPNHWQTLWHQHHPDWYRIQHDDWTAPDLPRWRDALLEVLDQSNQSLTLVAHSFGCLASVAATQIRPDKVRSLFLVAPADPMFVGLSDELFSSAIPKSGRVIASTNDHWMSLGRVSTFAKQWQLPVSVMGPLGHINADSGQGEWPEGIELLQSHIQSIESF